MTQQLDAVDLHLLLATSGQVNLLFQLEDSKSLDALTRRLESFFSSSSTSRSIHILPSDLADRAIEPDDVLTHFFGAQNEGIEGEEGETQSNEVPQILVIPLLEDYQRYLQIALKAVLREGRFDLKGQTYILPRNFLLIGVTVDRERIAHFLVDTFGLFLEIEDTTSPRNLPSIPPLIPILPKAYHSPKVRVYAADLLSALRHHPLIDNALLTAKCDIQHLFKMATLWIRLKKWEEHNSAAGTTQSYEQNIEIRPADIGDILSSCVLHRLRARLPEQRWDSFWNTQPPNEQSQAAEDALRNGSARLRYDLIIQQTLDKV